MTREDPIVIVSAVRTPMGGFLGDFALRLVQFVQAALDL
ncbi:hypothetical protein, partial [Pseudomonas aeruginosa]